MHIEFFKLVRRELFARVVKCCGLRIVSRPGYCDDAIELMNHVHAAESFLVVVGCHSASCEQYHELASVRIQ